MRKINKDVRVLIFIILPFALVSGVIMALSDSAGGWAVLEYFVYAIVVAALGLTVAAGYLVWIVIRDRWRSRAGIAASSVLGLAALIAAGWGANVYRENQICIGALEYYEELAAAAPDRQAALIAEGGAYITQPDLCARDGLLTWHGRNPAAASNRERTDAERLATLQAMLEAGLPPDHTIMYGFAHRADVGAVRLLMARRQALHDQGDTAWSGFPIAAARMAANRARCFDPAKGPQETNDQLTLYYREILTIMALAVPPPGKEELGFGLHRDLVCLGLVPG